MVVNSFHLRPDLIRMVDNLSEGTGIPKSYIARNAIESFRERKPFVLKDYIDWAAKQAASEQNILYKKQPKSFSLHPAQIAFLQKVSQAFGCTQSNLMCYILDSYIDGDWGYKLNAAEKEHSSSKREAIMGN